MRLVRDLLDKVVVDRHGHPLGRVDTILLEVRDDGPPIIAAIEIGLISIAGRLHPVLGRIARAIEVMVGIEGQRPVRIPMSKVIDCEFDVKVDLNASEVSSLAFEQKARGVVSAIPGAM